MTYNINQTPGNVNLKIVSGDDLTLNIDLNQDITDYTITAEIEAETTNISFDVAIVSATAGTITLSLTDVQTALIVSGNNWFMQWVDDSDKVLTLLKGIVTLETQT